MMNASNTDKMSDVVSDQATLELKDVSRVFGDEWEREEIIKDFSLTVRPGELTVIVGPSGCGKSTLVNLIAGFDKPDSGEVLLNGEKDH